MGLTLAEDVTVLTIEEAAHELVAMAHWRPPKSRDKRYVSIRMPHYFREAVPIGPRYSALTGGFDDVMPLGSEATDWELFTLPDVRDTSIIFAHSLNDEFDWKLAFQRVQRRRASHSLLQQVRDLTIMRAEHLMEITQGRMLQNGRWHSTRWFLGRVNGTWREWSDVERRAGPYRSIHSNGRGGHPTTDDFTSYMAMQSGLRKRYAWQLVFGYAECASISMPVERDALPDLVKLREVPEGKKRRAALANFVAAHRRRGRSQAPTEDPAIWVRKHLRGERFFRWDGLVVEVRPPAFDLERLAQEHAS